VGSHDPVALRSAKLSGREACLELRVAPQIEAVRDMVYIAQNLGLSGVELGPAPLLQQRFGELVPILLALEVAARARTAVPVTGAAHALAGLEQARREPEAAHAVQHVHADET